MLFVLFSYLPCELALIVLLVGLLYRNKSKTLRYFNFSMVFLVFTLGFYSFLVNATGDEKIADQFLKKSERNLNLLMDYV